MSFVAYLREERHKIIVDIAVTASGFLLALLANSAVDDWKEKQACDSVIRAIRAEAVSNEVVFRESFERYYQHGKGTVLRSFQLSSATVGFSNPVFLDHASSEQVSALAKYIRDLTLANAYREKVEKLRFPKPDPEAADFDKAITDVWKSNLDDCRGSIKTITELIR